MTISTKDKEILEHFIKGLSLNRFEAERLGEPNIDVTVRYFWDDCGISFVERKETMKNPLDPQAKKHTRRRYWLDDLGMEKAKKFLIKGK